MLLQWYTARQNAQGVQASVVKTQPEEEFELAPCMHLVWCDLWNRVDMVAFLFQMRGLLTTSMSL